ncbi:MAG: DUF6883 domain-containing protein [Aggregatilineales bacterium]
MVDVTQVKQFTLGAMDTSANTWGMAEMSALENEFGPRHNVKIPVDRLVIPSAKFTRYLLVWRDEDDKSRFLAQAGFTLENPAALEAAIRELVLNANAERDRANEYGVYYQVKGFLTGPNGRILAVITIWINEIETELYRFVTLKPWRKANDET